MLSWFSVGIAQQRGERSTPSSKNYKYFRSTLNVVN
jgi:hypothetical protein